MKLNNKETACSYEAAKAQDKHSIRVITLEQNILEENDIIAEENRNNFKKHNVFVVNLISSPGSGKTTLLVKTVEYLKEEFRCAVIEGDQQTSNDAKRIAETGVPVVQINTNSSCHINAAQIREAMASLPVEDLDLLIIENVGYLVCPAEFDLGENKKIAIMSVCEGEDKPIKYPLLFSLSDLLVLTKIDLLPYLRFDMEMCKQYAQNINPNISIFETSSYTEKGLENWINCLRKMVRDGT